MPASQDELSVTGVSPAASRYLLISSSQSGSPLACAVACVCLEAPVPIREGTAGAIALGTLAWPGVVTELAAVTTCGPASKTNPPTNAANASFPT